MKKKTNPDLKSLWEKATKKRNVESSSTPEVVTLESQPPIQSNTPSIEMQPEPTVIASNEPEVADMDVLDKPVGRDTTRNPTYAECFHVCRVQNLGHSANRTYAECLDPEEEEDAGGVPTVWQRGPCKLPKRPIANKPVIRPVGRRSWEVVTPGSHNRLVNGILGLLLKSHFPGLVEIGGVLQVPKRLEHYALVPDSVDVPNFVDLDRQVFPNKAECVIAELWDFYRCEPGYEAQADATARFATKKLFMDMYYEARAQCIVDYYARHGQRKTKDEAKTMRLSREEYIESIPSWCASHPSAWEFVVDNWCRDGWEEEHEAARARRLMMQGPAHHQGSRSLAGYASKWSNAHGGEECNTFQAYAMAHKGRASSDIRYDPADGPEAYSNPSIHNRLASYSEVGKEVHGQDWDPSAHDLDKEVVMRIGGGRKHGRALMGDSTLDTSSTRRLSQLRARSTSSGPSIHQRPTVSSSTEFVTLQTQLAQAHAKIDSYEQTMAEQARQLQETQRQMASVMAYVQSLGTTIGHVPFDPTGDSHTNPGSGAASTNMSPPPPRKDISRRLFPSPPPPPQ